MYETIENELQEINRDCIALPEDEVRTNNQILEEIVKGLIIPAMQEDPLFCFLYREIFHAGSFFIDLKVAHPDEYDLVLLLDIPPKAGAYFENSDTVGYMTVWLEGMKQFNQWLPKKSRQLASYDFSTENSYGALPARTTRPPAFVRTPKLQGVWNNIKYNYRLNLTQDERTMLSGLVDLMDNDYYLNSSKTSTWIWRLIKRALGFRKNYGYVYTTYGRFKATLKRSGPACTLKIRGIDVTIDIDLVPGFTSTQWPEPPFRKNPYPKKKEYFVVPKKPHDVESSVYWRSSFQRQERELIHDLQNFKPAIRLIKWLRDVLNYEKFVSYHIKTIFLWGALERNADFWKKPLDFVFRNMLRRCIRVFKKGKLLDYWNMKENLLEGIDDETLDGIYYDLTDILRRPYLITKYLKWHRTNETEIF